MSDEQIQPPSGLEYLVGTAEQAAAAGQPFAAVFSNMIRQSVGADALLMGEVIASRELSAEEASPISIILTAAGLAEERDDREGRAEVLHFGLQLLAKWSEYLVARDAHPSLQFKSNDDPQVGST